MRIGAWRAVPVYRLGPIQDMMTEKTKERLMDIFMIFCAIAFTAGFCAVSYAAAISFACKL